MADRLRVATTVGLPERFESRLASATVETVRIGALAEARGPLNAVIVTITDVVDSGAVDALRAMGVRLIANVGAGTNNIDLVAARGLGVEVTNTPDVLSDATADLAMGLILDVSRRISEGDRLIRGGAAWSWAFDFMWGQSLLGKKLGVVGYGRIGEALAHRARAFGMEVMASSRRPRDRSDVVWVSQDELFREADMLSLHCPLTPDTHHLVNAERLRQMKTSAILINTARGPVVDENALVAALRDGTIAGAGLDVYENEPALAAGLAELENVTLAPHLGSATRETREAMAELAVENVLAWAQGAALITPVTSA